jgi:hypothetical protein
MTFDQMVALMHEWEQIPSWKPTDEQSNRAIEIIIQIEAIASRVPFTWKWLHSERTTTIDMIIAATDRTTLEEIKYDMEHLDE